jgi:hypothetical protein
LLQVRPLGAFAAQLDALFLHRHERLVRKDGTVSYGGNLFEVPYQLVGQTVQLVVDPHKQLVVGVESTNGDSLGKVTPLDPLANNRRKRRTVTDAAVETNRTGTNLVEVALEQKNSRLAGREV